MTGQIGPSGQSPDGHALAQAIVDTIREPLLVLDGCLRVLVGSRSFYRIFQVDPAETEGQLVYALGDGQWDIPALRQLLEQIVPKHGPLEDYEVTHDFHNLGRRTMLLNARKMATSSEPNTGQIRILLAFEDVTARRTNERALSELLRQKEVLLEEMQHRVANSLQLIASILMLKARSVASEETRRHLQDAHQRVLSIAAVQEHLRISTAGEPIQVGPYLTKLCEALASSMIRDERTLTLEVHSQPGTVSSGDAVSIGLMVTELVINALKHAFPSGRPGVIKVFYDVNGPDWQLRIADNGVGMASANLNASTGGLGTSLISALAQQLAAVVNIATTAAGTAVSITHATFQAAVEDMPLAACCGN
jgi:two-component sensor histidine kinase